MKTTLKNLIKYRQLLILALPGVLFLFIFNYIPLYGLILPFKDYKVNLGFFKSPWSGLENFKFLINSDALFRITRNTVGLNLAFILTLLACAIITALLLNELSKKWVKVYQTALFLPFFLSWVVASYVFLSLLDMDHGLINAILGKFGIDAVLWYNDPKYWPVILIIANVWKNIGYHTVIYYAGLLSINSEYYEAADLDGATKIQKVRHISLPLLKPLISMMVLLQVGKIFYGNFDMFYNLTRDVGSLYSTTDIIDTYVFRALRSTGNVGMAAAAGAYQAFVGFLIVLAANFVVKKINPDNALF